MIGPRSFLTHRRYRYLLWSTGLLVLAAVGYGTYGPVGEHSGNSALGYGYGAIAAGLILWLMWFGIRKRQHATTGAPVRGWLSAHVYLGSALLVLVPLHAGFQVGWNVHTLAFALMTVVVLTGFVGVVLYGALPQRITRNMPGQTLDALLQQIGDVDGECRFESSGLPDDYALGVARAIDETRIGGGILRQLSGRDPGCPTDQALEALKDRGQRTDLDASQRAQALRVVELLSLKRRQLEKVRRDVRYRALLDLWLLIHVPLAFATVAAVFIHVFVVFYYW